MEKKDAESLWYEQIAEEIEKGEVDKGLWTKAISLSENDNKRIESEYIKLRFSKFKKDRATERNGAFVKKLKSFLIGFAVFLVLGVVLLIVLDSLKDTRQSDFGQATTIKESPKEDIRTIEISPVKNSDDGVITFSDLQFESLGQSVPNDSVFYRSYDKETNGNFLHVSILVINNSSSSEYISIKNVSLNDDKDRQFKFLERRRQCGSDVREDLEGLLKPYIPCRYNFLFEVPPDVVTGKLEIKYTIRESEYD
jgi:hypothetical protein